MEISNKFKIISEFFIIGKNVCLIDSEVTVMITDQKKYPKIPIYKFKIICWGFTAHYFLFTGNPQVIKSS